MSTPELTCSCYVKYPKPDESFPRSVDANPARQDTGPRSQLLYAAKNASRVWEQAIREGKSDVFDDTTFWLGVFDKVWEWNGYESHLQSHHGVPFELFHNLDDWRDRCGRWIRPTYEKACKRLPQGHYPPPYELVDKNVRRAMDVAYEERHDSLAPLPWEKTRPFESHELGNCLDGPPETDEIVFHYVVDQYGDEIEEETRYTMNAPESRRHYYPAEGWKDRADAEQARNRAIADYHLGKQPNSEDASHPTGSVRRAWRDSVRAVSERTLGARSSMQGLRNLGRHAAARVN